MRRGRRLRTRHRGGRRPVSPQLQRYGISDDDAFAVGLTCGGIIDIFAEPVSQHTFPQLGAVADDIAAHRPVAVATVIAHPDPAAWGGGSIIGEPTATGSLGSARADDAVADDARGLLAAGRTAVLSYGPDGERQRRAGMEVFVASHAPRPRMLVFGAIDFAAALAQQASVPRLPRHGVRRPAGLRHARHGSRPPTRSSSTGRTAICAAQPDAGALDARTAICVLTHDRQVRRSACSKWRCGCPRSATSE